MYDMSDTDLQIEFVFEGELVLKGIINRIYAPLIVEEIKSRLPLEGRTALMRDEMKITLGISKGNAKPTNDVKKADIAYQPLGDSLDIYLSDKRTFSQVNVIGRITSDESELDALVGVRRGSLVTIRLVE
ncbi:MAG: cyclophilin-like family protein [Candidatus Thorarchaeota archaeon]